MKREEERRKKTGEERAKERGERKGRKTRKRDTLTYQKYDQTKTTNTKFTHALCSSFFPICFARSSKHAQTSRRKINIVQKQ